MLPRPAFVSAGSRTRRSRFFLFGVLVVLAGCVEVPDSIRVQFAGPGPNDRSNFRHGLHGKAPPNEETPRVAEVPSGEATVSSAAVPVQAAGADGGVQ